MFAGGEELVTCRKFAPTAPQLRPANQILRSACGELGLPPRPGRINESWGAGPVSGSCTASAKAHAAADPVSARRARTCDQAPGDSACGLGTGSIKLDDLDVICAVLGCPIGDVLIPEPEKVSSQPTRHRRLLLPVRRR